MYVHIFLEKCMKVLYFDSKIVFGDDYYFYRNSFLNHTNNCLNLWVFKLFNDARTIFTSLKYVSYFIMKFP